MNDPESAWDREYRRGRYLDEPPIRFVDDIRDAAKAVGSGLQSGLYVGCGNGRNYIPLVQGGLDLDGLDISGEAISQLRKRLPERADRLYHGDLRSLPSGRRYDIVIGIQVFQHGLRSEAHADLALAKQFVAPDGMFCLRVNAVGTDLWPEHEVIEEFPDGGFTVRYLAGPKIGLPIHFFSRQEIHDLFVGWDEVLPVRVDLTARVAPAPGQWSQWEGIWRQRHVGSMRKG
ncbi:MAG: class I SAM-dependent methyltransferase [Actinomycetota bacterium]